MPRGDKSKYSDKQKRKAEHIEEGYEDEACRRTARAERRAGEKRLGDGHARGHGGGEKRGLHRASENHSALPPGRQERRGRGARK